MLTVIYEVTAHVEIQAIYNLHRLAPNTVAEKIIDLLVINAGNVNMQVGTKILAYQSTKVLDKLNERLCILQYAAEVSAMRTDDGSQTTELRKQPIDNFYGWCPKQGI